MFLLLSFVFLKRVLAQKSFNRAEVFSFQIDNLIFAFGFCEKKLIRINNITISNLINTNGIYRNSVNKNDSSQMIAFIQVSFFIEIM